MHCKTVYLFGTKFVKVGLVKLTKSKTLDRF